MEAAFKQRLSVLLKKETKPLVSVYWRRQIIMGSLMKNSELRTMVLRLLDVFPSLSGSETIREHCLEYASAGFSGKAPAYVVSCAMRAPPSKIVAAVIARKTMLFAANQFIVGESEKEIIRYGRAAEKIGAACSFDVLGEQVLSEDEEEQYQARYLDLIKKLSSSHRPIDVSVKLSSLCCKLDPLNASDATNVVLARLGKIWAAMQPLGGRIIIDMESTRVKDLTLDIFEQALFAFRGSVSWGIAHQAYLKDSEDSLRQLLQIAKNSNSQFTVRLVKGAYWDFEVADALQKNWPVPVYTERSDTDESFKNNANMILHNYPLIRIAVGSHNLDSLAHTMARHHELGLPKEALELQVLYGLGGPLVRPLVKMGYPVTVYTGIGNIVDAMSYLARRLLENTSQASSAFFARH